MKIEIKESGGKKFSFNVPHWLLTSRLGIRLLAHQLYKDKKLQLEEEGKADEAVRKISSEEREVLRQALKEVREKYGEFPLVEISRADGEYIKVTL